ncbi:MAG: hypothetical protein JRI23_02660 [Deltaproteobacteria bacterium]|nr:hypothetical protein [Deltaproteobacteria bacterium]MBW2530402.1 hypothetical protein [Deltaproteobacteria bacterium]
MQGIGLCFATPRGLPKPNRLGQRVVVLDIAFAADAGGQRFDKTTGKLIGALGDRLVAWVDHHDSIHHRRFAEDRRFLLATKAQHGACPEMIDEQVVARFPRPDTIVCHVDFDGLASAAKWIRGGREPYPGCDADARAIDTCRGEPGVTGAPIDRALRARPRDARLQLAVVRYLVSPEAAAADWTVIEDGAASYGEIEEHSRELAAGYQRLSERLSLVTVPADAPAYDKTLLLLLGQEQAPMAAVVDGDTVTFAAAFDSGIDFLSLLGLSGGMPTRVSIQRHELAAALRTLGVPNPERVAP